MADNMEPIEILDNDDDIVIEILTDSEPESPKVSNSKRNNTHYQVDKSYDVIPISLSSPPAEPVRQSPVKKNIDMLSKILADDSDDEDIVIRPSQPIKSNLFVPPDSSFSTTGIAPSTKGTPIRRESDSMSRPASQQKSSQQKSSQQKEVVTISSSSQPIRSTPKITKAPLKRTISENIPKSQKKKKSADKYLDSDSDSDIVIRKTVPSSQDRSLILSQLLDDETKKSKLIHSSQGENRQKIFLSSTPERIDAISSIGEIKPSTRPSKPLYSIPNKYKDIEFSDSDDEDTQKIPETGKSNAFLDKLTKLSDKRQKKIDKIREESAANIKRITEITARSKAQRALSNKDLSSDPIQASQPAIRSYSETALPEQHIEPLERPAQRTSKTTGTTRKSKEERELEKQRQLEEKTARQLYQDANRVNRKKDDLLAEMIIKIPRQCVNDFKPIDYKTELEPIEVQEVGCADNFIFWSRKTRSDYDPETNLFTPCPLKHVDEKVCVFVYTAQEFIQMMEMETLSLKFNDFRSRNKKIDNFIILINGYDQLIQKLKLQENRSYTARVRSQYDDADENPGRKRPKSKKATASISSYSADEVETEISQLQVNGFKVFPTKNTHETVLWLKSFTYTISSARYDKVERNPDLANIGTIKSGANTHDTYLKMLLQFKFMSEVKANRIIDQLPTLLDLYNAVNNNRLPLGSDGRPLMMSNIQSLLVKLFSTMDDGELLEQ